MVLKTWYKSVLSSGFLSVMAGSIVGKWVPMAGRTSLGGYQVRGSCTERCQSGNSQTLSICWVSVWEEGGAIDRI